MIARAAPAPDSPGAGAVGPGPPRRRRRWGRWLLALGLGLIVLVAAGLLAIRHPPIATGLVNAVLGGVTLTPRSTTRVQAVRGDWITGLELVGLRVTRGDTLLAAADTLRARYGLMGLFAGRLEVDEIHAAGVLVTSDLADTTRPPKKKTKPAPTPADLLRGRFYSGPRLRVERVTLRDARYGGHAGAPDSAFTHAELRARRVSLGGGFSFAIDTLGLRGRGVTLGLAAALEDGRFELRTMRVQGPSSDVDARGFAALGARDTLAEAGLTLRARPLTLRDLQVLIPGLRWDGAILAEADLRGTRADRLSGTIAASTERAGFGSFVLGPTRLDATLTDGRADLKASARYEGARATLGGWARPLDAAPSYDLDFEIDRLPARLPGAPGWAALAERVDGAARLRIRGTGYARADLEVTGRVEIDDGGIDLDGRLDVTRDFTWNVKRLAFDRLDVAALAGDTTTSAFTGTLTASGAGLGPESRRAAATLEIGPSHYGGLAVAGARVRARMDGSNLGGSLRLQTDAGAIEVDSLTTQWAGPGRFRVNGAFHDVDLARLARQPALPSRLEGTLSAQGRGLTALGAPGGPAMALREGRLAGEARLELKPSEFRGLEIAGVTRVVLARGALEIGGNLASPAGRIDLDADARPFDAAPAYALRRARFEDVDLAAWSGVPSLTSRLSGSLTGAGHPGDASGRTEDWRAALHLDPSRVGPADLEGGAVRATWSAGRAGVVASLRASGDTASVRGDIDLRGGERRGQATLSIPFGLLAAAIGRDSLPSRGGLEATASFSGASPARATAEGRITGRGAIDRARLDSLFAGFRLSDGTLTLDTLVARSNLGVARGAGRVALFDSTATDSSDLRLALTVSDLLPLRSLVGADTLALGSGTLDLHLGGTAVDRTVDGRASLRSAAWNNLRLLGATGSVEGALDRGWRPTKVNMEASIRRLHGLAMPVSEGAVRATLAGERTDFDLTVKLDEAYGLHAVGQSQADSTGTRLTLATIDVQADSAAWKLVRTARVDLRPGRVGIEDFDLRSAGGRITAQGVIDRRGDQDFRLDLRGVPLDIVSQWLGRDDVNGTLSGAFALAGPAAAPKGRGDLLLDLLSEGEAAGSLRSNLAWDGAQLDFRGRFATPESDSIAWTGHLPLAVSLAATDSAGAPAPVRISEGEVDVRITADRFPLAGLSPLLDPRVMGQPSGILDIDAGIRGRSRTLAGSGSVALIDGALPFPGLGVTYQDLNLMARFDGNRLALQRAHAVSNKGTLDVSGEIRFVSATQVEPRLQIKASRFEFVQTPDLRAILSGEVDLSGSLAEPVVKATATIENSTFTFAQSDLAGGTPGSEVKLSDADLRMMEETFGYVNAKTPTGDLVRGGYEASDLDLSIRLERNNWLRQRVQPKLAVALTGQFRIRKKPHAEPELFGRIEPIPGRGYVEQFARSFDIVGGEVLLNGKMKDHRVDLQAQYKPPTSTESSEDEVVVNLDVEGTAEKLSLTLSSEPAMSEAEIVNFIATGQSPVDHSSSGSSESNMLKDIGLSAVSGGAEQAAQEKIGLDVLQVRFDALQGATLVAGRYLDSQLYVGFRQPLQYQDTGTTNSETTSRTSVEVEYAIYRWLVVNLQGETSKLRSFFRARHAY